MKLLEVWLENITYVEEEIEAYMISKKKYFFQVACATTQAARDVEEKQDQQEFCVFINNLFGYTRIKDNIDDPMGLRVVGEWVFY